MQTDLEDRHVQEQARRFLRFYEVTGGDMREAFQRWAGPRCKDFWPADARRIWDEIMPDIEDDAA